MTAKKPILWLASWYPNRVSPFDGDFIQRHARAVSLLRPVQVLHVKKDDGRLNAGQTKIETTTQGDLVEKIGYYKPYKTGLRFLDGIISIFQYFFLYKKLINDFIAESGKPGLIHVHVAMRAGLVAFWLKRSMKIPYIITEHWTGYSRKAVDNIYERNIIFRRLTITVIRNAALVLPVSKSLERDICELTGPVACEVVRNVVDVNLFQFRQTTNDVFTFFHASSLNFQKNPAGMLRSFAALKNIAVSWRLVVAGPVQANLKELGDHLGIGQAISWLGEVAYPAVAEQMQQSDALVMFSRFENLPCVIAEALCCGLTVVSSSVGGVPEIIDGQNGILVETENESQFSEALSHLLTEGHSTFDKKEIAKTAASLYNYQLIATQIINVYRRFDDAALAF